MSSDFLLTHGELRSTIGVHVWAIAAMLDLEVEDGLATTLLDPDDDRTGPAQDLDDSRAGSRVRVT
jgi:hypothetical protein